jgi:hypothetical protein
MYALHGAPSTANNQLMAQRTHLKKVDARSLARLLATKTYCLIKIPLSTFSSSPFCKYSQSSWAKRQLSTSMLLKCQENVSFAVFKKAFEQTRSYIG